jgi:hypothetical protein
MSVMCGAYLCLPYICTNSQKNTPHMRCRRKRSAGPSKRAACWFRGHHFFLVSYWLRSSPANLAGSYRVEVRVNGNYAWNLNAQGQPVAQPADVAGDRQLTIWSHPVGFIKAGLEGPRGHKCGGHRPLFRPAKPHRQGRRIHDQSLRWAAAAMHPPDNRRVQQRQHARAGDHLGSRPGHGRQEWWKTAGATTATWAAG